MKKGLIFLVLALMVGGVVYVFQEKQEPSADVTQLVKNNGVHQTKNVDDNKTTISNSKKKTEETKEGNLNPEVKDEKALGISRLKPEDKIRVKENSVEFYDTDENLVYSVALLNTTKSSWSDVVVSDNQKFVSINNVLNYTNELVNKANLDVYDDKGVKVWSVENHLTSHILSPNGRYIIGGVSPVTAESSLFVYWKGDSKVKEIKKPNIIWEGGFSPSGKYFFIVVQSISNDKSLKFVDRHSAILSVYDENGEKILNKEISKGIASFGVKAVFLDEDRLKVVIGVSQRNEFIINIAKEKGINETY